MKLIREDHTVGWIVLVFALSQLIAVGWDLPGAYGWENDGIAPRDFFAGLAINLTPWTRASIPAVSQCGDRGAVYPDPFARRARRRGIGRFPR